ncbi:putative G-protein coupled receptor F59B2.13 [Lineus longissimus]|uniref:putative G-protein coupled receptor F59B2.13 n=1 Tax=Lineus longissimus TaxID=88925 RepID=UPI002B4F95CF
MDTFFDQHDKHTCDLPEEPVNHVTFLFHGCILPVLVLFGCVNNLLVIRILCKMNTKSATAILLNAVAVSDFMYLTSTVVTWIGWSWYEALGELCTYMENFTLAIPFLIGFYETICDIVVWVFVMLLIERYVSMTYFIMDDKYCVRHGQRGGVVVVALSFLLATTFNIPAIATYRIISKTVSENGSSVVVVPEGLSTMDNVGYSYYTLDCILNIFIPLGIGFLMTSHMIIILYSKKGRQGEYTYAQGENSHTKVDKGGFATVAVVIFGVLLILCETPRILQASLVLAQTKMDKRMFLDIIHYCSVSFITLQAVNSFFKLFIYCTVSKEFKTATRSLYSRQKHRHKQRKTRSVVLSTNNQRLRSDEEQGIVEESQ